MRGMNLGTVTGEMRSFMERLLFPYLTYTTPIQSLFPRKINSGFIYTMNIREEYLDEYGYNTMFETNENYLKMLFGSAESLMSFDTYQFNDYSRLLPIVSMQRKKLKDELRYFQKIAGEHLKWE